MPMVLEVTMYNVSPDGAPYKNNGKVSTNIQRMIFCICSCSGVWVPVAGGVMYFCCR